MRDSHRVGYGAASERGRSIGRSHFFASTPPARGPLPLSTREHSDVDVVEKAEENFPRLDTDDESSDDRDASRRDAWARAFGVGQKLIFERATSRRASGIGEEVEVAMTRARGFGGDEDEEDAHRQFTRRASRTHVGAPVIYPSSSMRRDDRTRFERKRRLEDWRHAAPMTGAFCDGENFARWERASADRYRSLRSARVGSMGGIPNLGNSCYISSTLQLLKSMKKFVEDVGAVDQSLEKPLLSALRDFFESDIDELSAAGVKLAMSRVRDDFGEYDQHDAMEFLTVLLETIENEIGDSAASCPSRKNFLWRIDHELKCAKCGKANTIQETMYALTLQIEPDERESVETLLERFFTTEALQRKCEECHHDVSQSSRRIVSQPRVLLLHLKRFSATYERGKMHLHKLSASIRLPRSVSLRLFADESDDQSPPGVKTPRADSPSSSLGVATTDDAYALLSVIAHFGNSIQTGHYVCHRREDRSSSWRTFDDERVTPYVARNDESALVSAQEFERECYVVAYETTTRTIDAAREERVETDDK